MTATLTFRPYKEEDIDPILSLWEKCSDFGTVDRKTFEGWLLETPYEKTSVIVAVDDDARLVGQMHFLPSRVLVDGRLVKSMKIAAPIVDPTFRFTDPMSHPVFGMFTKGIAEAKRNGFDLFYIFPAKGWLRMIEMYTGAGINWQTASYNTFAAVIDTPENYADVDDGLVFKQIQNFSEEHSRLWDAAVESLPVTCGIVRHKDWLNFRLSHHCLIEARNSSHSLIGYMAIKKQSGLMVDLLAPSKEEARKMFWGCMQFLARQYPGKTLIETGKVTGMYTDFMKEILDDKHIEFPNYRFDFGCCVLGDTIAPAHVKPARWHMMPDV